LQFLYYPEYSRSMAEKTSTKYWLITGAGGYIGKHVINELLSESIPVVASDKLPIDCIGEFSSFVQYYEADLTNSSQIERIFEENIIEGVIHLAALKSVEASEKDPSLYRNVNVLATLSLLRIMEKHKVTRFIFTSSAAVYGELHTGIADESARCSPTSNYGRNKLEVEDFLANYNFSRLRYISLRLFNVAGSISSNLRDKSQDNLIPILFQKLKTDGTMQIFGSDYQTTDGTACRDFVHVADVARAYSLGIKYLNTSSTSKVINIGSGSETSVMQITGLLAKKLGKSVKIEFCDRRAGDVGKLIANTQLAQKTLGFKASISIDEILTSIT